MSAHPEEWIRIAVGYWEDPKILRAGGAAAGEVHQRMIAYCKTHPETAGVVPRGAALGPSATRRVLAAMEREGLIVATPDGWTVPKVEIWQNITPRGRALPAGIDDAEAERRRLEISEKRRAAGAAGAAKTNGKFAAIAPANGPAKSGKPSGKFAGSQAANLPTEPTVKPANRAANGPANLAHTSGDPGSILPVDQERFEIQESRTRASDPANGPANLPDAGAANEPPRDPLAGWGRHLAAVPVGALPEAWRCAEAAFSAWYRQRRRLPWKASAASGRALRGLAVAIADTAAATGLTEEAVIDRALANFGADPFAVTSDFPPALLETKWGAYFDPPEIPRPKGAMHPCPPPGAHGNDLADQLGLEVANG